MKKGSQTITEYIQKIKHFSDSLLAALCPVDDEDLLIHTLNGFPSEFGPFKTSICTRSSLITIEELHVLLICEEMNMEGTSQSHSDFSFTALLTSWNFTPRPMSYNSRGQSGYSDRGRGRNSNRGRGSFSQTQQNFSQSQQNIQSSRPSCQICSRSGHSALDCYHRIDYSYQGRHPPSQLAIMAASFTPLPEQT